MYYIVNLTLPQYNKSDCRVLAKLFKFKFEKHSPAIEVRHYDFKGFDDALSLQFEYQATGDQHKQILKNIANTLGIKTKECVVSSSRKAHNQYLFTNDELLKIAKGLIKQSEQVAFASQSELIGKYIDHKEITKGDHTKFHELIARCYEDFEVITFLRHEQFLNDALHHVLYLIKYLNHLTPLKILEYFGTTLVNIFDRIYKKIADNKACFRFEVILQMFNDALGDKAFVYDRPHATFQAMEKYALDYRDQRQKVLAKQLLTALSADKKLKVVNVADMTTRDAMMYRKIGAWIVEHYDEIEEFLAAFRREPTLEMTFAAGYKENERINLINEFLLILEDYDIVEAGFTEKNGTFSFTVTNNRHWTFLQGKWFEHYTALQIQSVVERLRNEQLEFDFAIYQNVSLERGRDRRELDLVFHVNDQIYYIENKAGASGANENNLAKYQKTLQLLDLPVANFRLVYLDGTPSNIASPLKVTQVKEFIDDLYQDLKRYLQKLRSAQASNIGNEKQVTIERIINRLREKRETLYYQLAVKNREETAESIAKFLAPRHYEVYDYHNLFNEISKELKTNKIKELPIFLKADKLAEAIAKRDITYLKQVYSILPEVALLSCQKLQILIDCEKLVKVADEEKYRYLGYLNLLTTDELFNFIIKYFVNLIKEAVRGRDKVVHPTQINTFTLTVNSLLEAFRFTVEAALLLVRRDPSYYVSVILAFAYQMFDFLNPNYQNSWDVITAASSNALVMLHTITYGVLVLLAPEMFSDYQAFGDVSSWFILHAIDTLTSLNTLPNNLKNEVAQYVSQANAQKYASGSANYLYLNRKRLSNQIDLLQNPNNYDLPLNDDNEKLLKVLADDQILTFEKNIAHSIYVYLYNNEYYQKMVADSYYLVHHFFNQSQSKQDVPLRLQINGDVVYLLCVVTKAKNYECHVAKIVNNDCKVAVAKVSKERPQDFATVVKKARYQHNLKDYQGLFNKAK